MRKQLAHLCHLTLRTVHIFPTPVARPYQHPYELSITPVFVSVAASVDGNFFMQRTVWHMEELGTLISQWLMPSLSVWTILKITNIYYYFTCLICADISQQCELLLPQIICWVTEVFFVFCLVLVLLWFNEAFGRNKQKYEGENQPHAEAILLQLDMSHMRIVKHWYHMSYHVLRR